MICIFFSIFQGVTGIYFVICIKTLGSQAPFLLIVTMVKQIGVTYREIQFSLTRQFFCNRALTEHEGLR